MIGTHAVDVENHVGKRCSESKYSMCCPYLKFGQMPRQFVSVVLFVGKDKSDMTCALKCVDMYYTL